MADCIDCGRKIGVLTTFAEGRCRDCYLALLKQRREARELGPEALADLNTGQPSDYQRIASIILTTEAAAPFEIVERIDIVTAECAFGMNIFKDLFAGLRDVFGGRSEAVQKTMRDARKTALHELRREAYEIGANAVIGVDLDYVELSGAGNMVMLVASGTAVKANVEM